MISLLMAIIRRMVVFVGWGISKILFNVTIDGWENMPANTNSLLLISNHFSWFDAPLLSVLLPFQPAFLVATESQRHWWVRLFVRLFNGIPIWRGQVDRNAFRRSLEALEQGYVLGVFPEGGMDPEVAERVARGEKIEELHGHVSRRSAQLVRAKPGSALLAIQSRARILPVGLLGTERIMDNLSHLRRTSITLRIGPVFGPLGIDPVLHGRARRRRLDELANTMMQQVAHLFPLECRGPYGSIKLEISEG
jgi:1-acyl-sn-glycerol-3-phosphate acyltransferase